MHLYKTLTRFCNPPLPPTRRYVTLCNAAVPTPASAGSGGGRCCRFARLPGGWLGQPCGLPSCRQKHRFCCSRTPHHVPLPLCRQGARCLRGHGQRNPASCGLVDDVHRPQMRPHIQALRECASSGSEARCAGQVRDQERSRTKPRVSDKAQGQHVSMPSPHSQPVSPDQLLPTACTPALGPSPQVLSEHSRISNAPSTSYRSQPCR